MELLIKRIGYFVGGIILLNIILSLFDNFVTYSPNSMEKKLKKLDKKILKKKESNNNKDSEYMKIIGDYKWTENLGTWEKRLPLCPITYGGSKGSGVPKDLVFPNRYPNGHFSYSKPIPIEVLRENCSIKVGGLNLQILSADKLNFYLPTSTYPDELNDWRNYFIEEFVLMFDSPEDSYLLYKVFQGKYNHCKKYNDYRTTIDNRCFETQFTEYRFRESLYNKSSLYISTTDKSEKVLRRIYEDLYRTQIKRNKLNPSEF